MCMKHYCAAVLWVWRTMLCHLAVIIVWRFYRSDKNLSPPVLIKMSLLKSYSVFGHSHIFLFNSHSSSQLHCIMSCCSRSESGFSLCCPLVLRMVSPDRDWNVQNILFNFIFIEFIVTMYKREHKSFFCGCLTGFAIFVLKMYAEAFRPSEALGVHFIHWNSKVFRS